MPSADETNLNQVQLNVEDTRSSFLETAQFTPTGAPVGESISFSNLKGGRVREMFF